MSKKLLLLFTLTAALQLNSASPTPTPEGLTDELLGGARPVRMLGAVQDTAAGDSDLSAARPYHHRMGLGLDDSDPDQLEYMKKLIEERCRRDSDDEYRNLSWTRYLFGFAKKAYSSLFGKNEESPYKRVITVQVQNDDLGAGAGSTGTSSIPSSVSLVTNDILNGMTFGPEMVYDQKNINACTAHVMAFIVRLWSVRNSPTLANKTNFTLSNPDLLNPSRIFHYLNAVKLIAKKEGLNGQDAVTAEQSIFALDKYGACPEKITTIDANVSNVTQQIKVGMIYPENADSSSIILTQPQLEDYRFALDTSSTGLSTGAVNPYALIAQKIRYNWLGKTDVQKYSAALSSGYPIFFGARLYSAFMNNAYFYNTGESPKPFFVPMPTEKIGGASQTYVGGHAMTIVGYGNYNPDLPSKNYFRVLNSWGPNWANGGFCYFPEEYIVGKTIINNSNKTVTDTAITGTSTLENTVAAYSIYFVK